MKIEIRIFLLWYLYVYAHACMYIYRWRELLRANIKFLTNYFFYTINFVTFILFHGYFFLWFYIYFFIYYDTTSMLLLLLLVMCVWWLQNQVFLNEGKKHKRNSLFYAFHLSLKALLLRICINLTENCVFSRSKCSLFLFKPQYFWSPF